jgi:hypothetical protein
VDVFNSATSTWSTAQLDTKRMDFAAVSVGNLAMFAGGKHSGAISFSHVDTVCMRGVCVFDACRHCRRSVARVLRSSACCLASPHATQFRLFGCRGPLQQCNWHVVDCSAQRGAQQFGSDICWEPGHFRRGREHQIGFPATIFG